MSEDLGPGGICFLGGFRCDISPVGFLGGVQVLLQEWHVELLHVAPERSGREKNTFLRRHGGNLAVGGMIKLKTRETVICLEHV